MATWRSDEIAGSPVAGIVVDPVNMEVIIPANVVTVSGADCTATGQSEQCNRADIPDQEADRAHIYESSSIIELHLADLSMCLRSSRFLQCK